MPLQTGDSAPDFTLFNTEKKKISLNDYKGKNVVLLFFPFAFSSTCTKEVCEMQENYSFYESMNAEIIGISVDSLYTNKKYKEVYHLNFTLLSDFNKEVSRQYDSLMENFAFDYKGVSKRSTFVIDDKGKIVYHEILASPGDYPDMQKLKDVVSSLN